MCPADHLLKNLVIGAGSDGHDADMELARQVSLAYSAEVTVKLYTSMFVCMLFIRPATVMVIS